MSSKTFKGTTSFSAWTTAMSAMNEAQIASILITNNQALGYNALNSVQMYNALIQAGLSKETAKTIVKQVLQTKATKAQAVAAKEAAASTIVLKDVIGGLWTTITKFAAANPLFTAMIAVGAAFGIAKIAADKFGVSAKGAAEKFEEAQNAYTETANELQSLNSELETTQSRIAELNELAKTGRLTPDQEAELKDLNSTNEALERKLKILEDLSVYQEREQAEAAAKSYQSTRYESKTQTGFDETSGTSYAAQMNGAEYIRDLVEASRNLTEQKEELEARKGELAELLAGGGLSKSQTLDAEYELSRINNEIAAIDATYAEYESELANVASEQEVFADSLSRGTDEHKAQAESIYEAIDAYHLLGASEQEVLAHLRDNASENATSTALALEPVVTEYLDAKEQYEKAFSESGGDAVKLVEPADRFNKALENLQRNLGYIENNESFQQLINEAIELDIISGTTRDDIIELILAIARIVDTSNNASSSVGDLTTHLQALGNAETNFGDLSDALAEFRDEGIVSIATLADLQEAFGTTDGFEKFVNIVGDSNSTFTEAKAAFDELATEWINNQFICKDLTENTKEMTIATLENIGVTNAAEVVEAKLSTQRVEAAIAALDEAEATEKAINKLYEEAIAGETSEAAIEALKVSHLRAIASSTDFANAGIGVTDSLIAQAKAANITGTALQRLVEIYQLQADLERNGYDLESEDAILAYETINRLKGELDAELSKYQGRVTISDVKISPTIKDSGSETDKIKEEFEEKYNAMKHELEMEKITIEEFYAWLNGNNGYKKYFSDLSKYADEWRKYEKECFDLEREIANAALDDLDHNISILERQTGTSTFIIVNQLSGATDELRIAQQEYQDILAEVADLGIDLSKTIYGNIDLNNRQVLEWTESNLAKYKDAIMSWQDASAEWESVASDWLGTISTVYGGSENFDGLEIAFSPMLQTPNGAVLLERDTVIRYINELLGSLSGTNWSTEDLLRLDATGLEINGQRIKNLIADVGETAILTGEAMHFAGAEGAVEQLRKEIERLKTSVAAGTDSLRAQVRVEDQLIDKYREKQAIVKGLIDSQIAYLRAQGMSEAEIANNDTLQEYLETWYQIQDAIDDIIKTLNDDLADSMNTLLEYTVEMIKLEKEDEKEALEEQKDLYKEIVESRKEMLRISEQERKYQDEVAAKTAELAKIEARLATLKLDNSREARVEEGSLQEQKAALQKELQDLQNEHFIDSTEAALDKELENWENQQDDKIEEIEDFLDDEYRITQIALKRLDNANQDLFDDLLNYALKYTDTTRAEFKDMWDEALAAAEKYGSYVNAMDAVPGGDKETEASRIIAEMNANRTGYASATTQAQRNYYSSENERLGQELEDLLGVEVYKDQNGYWWIGDKHLFNYGTSSSTGAGGNSVISNVNAVQSIVQQMRNLGAKWGSADAAGRKKIHDDVADLADDLPAYGVTVKYNDKSGEWRIIDDELNPKNKGKLLYSVYHQGGIVGMPTAKQNEHLSLLERGEMVLTETHQKALDKLIEFSKKVSQIPSTVAGMFNSNNTAQTISVEAPLYITGDMSETKILSVLKKHSRLVANEVAKVVNVK